MAIKQYQEPGVCVLVDHNTLDTTGLTVRATAVGQQDELISDLSYWRYSVSASGAVLEAVSDGLRVAPAALDQALTGGGNSKIRVSVSKQPRKAVEDTDLILVEDAVGNLHSTTRQDVRSGGPIPGNSITGNILSGQGSEFPFVADDLAMIQPGVGDTGLGYNSSGQIRRYDLTAFLQTVNLDYVETPTDGKIANDSGRGVTIPPASSDIAGLMTASDFDLLHAIASGSTNLDATYTTTSVEITNTNGSNALITQVSNSRAGVLDSASWQQIQIVFPGQPANTVLGSIGGTPTWTGRNSYTLRPTLSSTRLLGWDASGNVGIFAPPSDTGGGEAFANIVHLANHSLAAGDIGKPLSIATGAVWDDTSQAWPSGLLAKILDPNTIEMIVPGMEVDLPSSLIQSGYDPDTDGRWLSWDYSANQYVTPKPSDSVPDVTEMVEVIGPSQAGWYALAHDHGPLGSGGASSDPGPDPPPPSEAEVVIHVGGAVPPPNAGEKVLFDRANGDIYTTTSGAQWDLFGDGDHVDTSSGTTLTVTNYAAILVQPGAPRTINAISGGHPGQTVILIADSGNVAVEASAAQLEAGVAWNPGSGGGSLTLRTFDGLNWFETARTTYTPYKNIVASKAS